MGKFRTDLAAVDRLQQGNNVPELHALVAGSRQSAGKEFAVQIGFGQTEVVQLQYAGHWPLHETERVDVGDLVPAQAVGLYQSRYSGLFFAGRHGAPGTCRPHAACATAISGLIQQVISYRRVRDFGIGVSQRLEILTPGLGNRFRLVQKLLVQGFDSTGIAAEERRRGVLFLQGNTHDNRNLRGMRNPSSVA